MNLADTYVNAFVNAGCGKDALMLDKKQGESPWIYRVKNEGLIAAAGSLGLLFLWDTDKGSQHIFDYLELTDGFAKAGACMAVGLYNCGVVDEFDQAMALLEE
jgi:26S proteasome regulatory subunit N1